ncbi:hypothetical protein [Erysipelothrix anatis]|uniref:hypothetical protein n=1 Tax=Erysipelothrix anatis TaxID=2683713 RepID=UPI00135CE4C7|nr:hypothetical protein [Erysipelothrix anatis]
MTKTDAATLLNSIQKYINLMNGPNWKYLSLATQTRIEYSYKGKVHKLYHLFVNEIIEPIAEVLRIITNFIVDLIHTIGHVFEEIGYFVKQSFEPLK